MEPTQFELTPDQRGLLEALSRETGRPVPALIAKALEDLQEHVHHAPATSEANGNDEAASTGQSHSSGTPNRSASVLDIFREAREAIPDEVWDTLPPDLAAQHDHYIYGTPKRPA